MSLKNHLFDRKPSGPKIWLIITVVLFIFFILVYQRLVGSSVYLETPDLPNKSINKAIARKELSEKQSSKTFNSFLTNNCTVTKNTTSKVIPNIINHVVKSGETLDGIFQRLGFSRQAMYSILEADEEYLVLDPLISGDTLIFKTNKEDKLESLSRRIDPSKSISYVRHNNREFTYQENTKPIHYSQEAGHGKIIGSFYQSAKKLGLSDANIVIIRDLFKERINFRKDLRTGNQFDVVLKTGDVDGEPVGKTQLEALQMTVKGQRYQAFLHSDGRFYDENGNGLTPTLLRWPTKIHYPITSSFNPIRRHPITKRISPHNGTDIGVPSDTRVLATGDGVVTRVAFQKYAGKYLDIDNLGPYGTRFLHLNKILVRKGEHIKRGQVVALSGNTGHTTGPHLHYELHINGKPVNPMTIDIPTLQSIPKSKIKGFKAHVKHWVVMMNDQPYYA